MKRIFSLCCVLAIISVLAGFNQSNNVKLNAVVNASQAQVQNQIKLKDNIIELGSKQCNPQNKTARR
jgi:hypothetical protein